MPSVKIETIIPYVILLLIVVLLSPFWVEIIAL